MGIPLVELALEALEALDATDELADAELVDIDPPMPDDADVDEDDAPPPDVLDDVLEVVPLDVEAPLEDVDDVRPELVGPTPLEVALVDAPPLPVGPVSSGGMHAPAAATPTKKTSRRIRSAYAASMVAVTEALNPDR